MRARRGAALLLAVLALVALVPSLRVAADFLPPTIADMNWSPYRPIHPSNVTIYANISDPDGVGVVYALWCSLGGLCDPPHVMTDMGGGAYQTTDVTTKSNTIGAILEVYASDLQANLGNTSQSFVLFVDSLNVTLTPPFLAAPPGAVASVNGTAYYGPREKPKDGENRSAPAEGVVVNVTVSGTTTQATVDATGHFTANVTAPTGEDTYPIVATARDRNLTGTADGTLAVSTSPTPDLTVANARVTPASPVAGTTVTLAFDVANVGTADASGVGVSVVLIRGTDETEILNDTVAVPQASTVPRSVSWASMAGDVSFRITVDPGNATAELNEVNNVAEVSLSIATPTSPPSDPFVIVWIVGGGAIAAVVAIVAMLALRRRRASRAPDSTSIESPPEKSTSRLKVAAVLLALALALAGIALVFLLAPKSSTAPEFQLVDVNGVHLNSTDLRGQVILLDFGATWCVPCKQVEKSYNDTLYDRYKDRVVFITVFIPPGNDPSSLENYSRTHFIRWHLTRDSDNLQTRYSIAEMPRMFVIDRDGYFTHDLTPSIPVTAQGISNQLAPALDATLQGTAGTISVTSLSIPALMVVAALLSFFSPCSFPVLPAFMAFYMNLDAKGETDLTRKPTTRTAASRGFVASLGMVSVYGIVAGVVFAAGLAAQGVIPFISPIVGVILIVMAVLTLLPYQYHFLTRPFIALKRRIAARFGGKWTPGVRAKLFAFGAGYGAAGFACVAPPFIGAMLNASAIGAPEQALFGLALYVIVVVVTMILVVVGLHVAGERLLKKIRVWSAVIKYVSAVALMIAGAYLLWLFASTLR